MEFKAGQIKLFFDSNVLIASTLSKKGMSFKLLVYCLRNQCVIMISSRVQTEVMKKLRSLGKEKVKRYEEIVAKIKEQTEFIIVDNPNLPEVKKALSVIHKNDAVILAAALKSNPDYLITYNRRHFITPKVKALCNFQCLTPDWFLRKAAKVKKH